MNPHSRLNQILAAFMPIVVITLIIMLFFVGFFLFSYLLILGLIIALVFLIANYIRSKFSRMQNKPTLKEAKKSGRIIEHDDHQR